MKRGRKKKKGGNCKQEREQIEEWRTKLVETVTGRRYDRIKRRNHKRKWKVETLTGRREDGRKEEMRKEKESRKH